MVCDLQDGYSIKEERLNAGEYIGFLKRTDLGSQYPAERFEERIPRLLEKASISLAARDAEGKLIGVLLGLTDYAYWLYITDLGVDRSCVHRGIGSALMKKAHELAGGEKDVAVYLIANDKAVPFYEKLGMKKADDVMVYDHVDWTSFTVK
ncbi:MAG: GNAT family N-acetyltransferase [Solobacterium sp.]|nr:GNAT family N-acetyltransferase [Solobacterium sp.]